MNHLSLVSSLTAAPTFGYLGPKPPMVHLSILFRRRYVRLEDAYFLSRTRLGVSDLRLYGIPFSGSLAQRPMPSLPGPNGLKMANRILEKAVLRVVDTSWRKVDRSHLRSYYRSPYNKQPAYHSGGSAVVRIKERFNNYGVVVRSPSGKTLGSWRGGIVKDGRKSRQSVASMVDNVEKTMLFHRFKSRKLEYSGTANLFFGVSRRMRFLVNINSVSINESRPHNGPRVKKLRRK